MLVVQRLVTNSATRVRAEATEQRNQHNQRRCLSNTTNYSSVKSTRVQLCHSEQRISKSACSVEFSLQGKPVHLQQRFSSHSLKKVVTNRTNSNKTFECNVRNNIDSQLLQSGSEKSAKKSKKISGGVRRASIRRRQDQQKPTKEVVYQQKSSRQTSRRRLVSGVRTPLLMNTMSLPEENQRFSSSFTSKETPQMFMNSDEAQATLKRLLASRNHHQLVTSSANKQANVTEEQSEANSAGENYLHDTYEYLFQRHVQTLNNVIKHHNHQQKVNEALHNNQQKQRKQVNIHQHCCGNGAHDNYPEELDAEDVSLNTHLHTGINSNQREDRFSSKTTEESRKLENHNLRQCESCCENGEFLSVTNNNVPHCFCSNRKQTCESSSMGHLNDSGSSEQGTGSNTICMNVSNQFQEIHLEEVEPALEKPMITFSHVSTSETYYKEQASYCRSRSPSPLLDVPPPVADVHQEMKRPPID